MKKILIAVAVVVLAAFAAPAFAATNPFMDVPASHWAYDAVAQLASRGVISGYPDGSYKGAQPATRYEMASIVARAMAKIDMEKASKQDVEMLKKLIIEFKDELDALGVKVDKLDTRLGVLEKEIGGWSMAGQLRFDANFGSGDTQWYADDRGNVIRGKNQFDLNRYRFWLRKRVNETTRFEARLGRDGGGQGMVWERYFITTQLGYGISMTVGRQVIDWEDELGLYKGNDAYVGDWTYDLFQFKKDWGMANLQLVIGRQNDGAGFPVAGMEPGGLEQFMIAGLANFNITEKFRAGIMTYYWITDEEVDYGPGLGDSDSDLWIVGGYMGYKFTPAIELKGIYYHQSMGDSWRVVRANGTLGDDTASAWKAILDVKQDALKFTSLWLEYGMIDNNFNRLNNNTYTGFDSIGASLLGNRPNNDNTTKVYGIRADQKWNDKWRTYLRYFAADYDTAGLDDAQNWTIGVAYRLNPAIEFELAYDNIDYGSTNTGNNGGRVDDDHMIRLRTFVSF